MDLEKFIRTVPDFPIKGINFYDITTLFENNITFIYIIELLFLQDVFCFYPII